MLFGILSSSCIHIYPLCECLLFPKVQVPLCPIQLSCERYMFCFIFRASTVPTHFLLSIACNSSQHQPVREYTIYTIWMTPWLVQVESGWILQSEWVHGFFLQISESPRHSDDHASNVWLWMRLLGKFLSRWKTLRPFPWNENDSQRQLEPALI